MTDPSMERTRLLLKLKLAARERGLNLYRPTKLPLQRWLKKNDPRSTWDWDWQNYLIPILGDAVSKPTRLAISLPPRSGKSYLISARLPVYFLDRFPTKEIIGISYSSLLATKFNREAREMARGIVPLDPNRTRVGDWRTLFGGGYFSSGVSGSLTGRGGNLLLADDLIQNIEESLSITQMDKIWDSFASDFLTRGEPGFSVIIISTRWSVDDVIGRLKTSSRADEWNFVNLKAIAEEDDPLDRPEGEVLNPQRQTLEQLLELQEIMGKRVFRALYQGEPTIPGGDLVKVQFIRIANPDDFQKFDEYCGYWDTSGGEHTAQTAGVFMGRKGKDYVIMDVHAGKWTQGERIRQMKIGTQKWAAMIGGRNAQFKVFVEQQPGSAGKEVADFERRELMKEGFMLIADRPSGKKEDRILPFAAMVESSHVLMFPGAWNRAYIDELKHFPHYPTKDQADATSGSFIKLYKVATSAIF